MDSHAAPLYYHALLHMDIFIVKCTY